MSEWLPLAFGDAELIMVAIFIVISILSALGKILSKDGKAQQRPGQQPPRPAGGGPRPAQPQAGGARPQAGGIEDEITEFLRRAAQGKRAGQPPRPAPPQQPPQPVVRRLAQPAPRRAAEPVVAEVAPQQQRPLGAKVQEHVGEYLDAGKFSRRASELGERVAQTDDQLDRRLHEEFDHEVSDLAGVPGESAIAPRVTDATTPEDRVVEIPATGAAGFAALLADTRSIRQAIVINEILQRPMDRWT